MNHYPTHAPGYDRNVQFHNPMNKVTKIVVEELMFRETGTFGNQFSRSYSTHLDNQALGILEQRAAQIGAGAMTPSAMSGIVGGIVSLDATPESSIPIAVPNSWQSTRMVFVMKVVVELQSGGQTKYHIQGYTDWAGVNLVTHSVAPEMEFYVNNVVQTRQVMERTPAGERWINHVVDNYQVLADLDWSAYDKPQNSRMMVRPQDVYNVLSTSETLKYSKQGANVVDTRGILRNTPSTSNKANSVATSYASRLIQGYMSAQQQSESHQPDNYIYNEAATHVREAVPAENPFLNALGARTQTGLTTSRFRWADLEDIDPNVFARTTVIGQGQTQAMQQHQVGMTADWNGTNHETRWAAVLSQAVPALMVDQMFSKLIFTCSNYEGQVKVTPIDGSNFTDTPIGPQWELFQVRFVNEVIRDLSENGAVSYNLSISSSIYGETRVDVALNSGPAIPYATPTFCDGLISPVLTGSPERVRTLADNFDTVVRVASEAAQSTQRIVSGAFTGARSSGGL